MQILQKYFVLPTVKRCLHGFILLSLLISMDKQGFSQTSAIDTTQSNNVAEPDSIIEDSDIGIDEEVIYFGKDSTVMDLTEKRVYLYGPDSYVKYGSLEVKASRISFSFDDYTAYASGISDSTGAYVGRPVFKDGDSQFEEDSLAYNFKSKKGLSYGARTQEGEAYLIAGVSKKQSNDWIHIGKGKFTTCDNPNPHYYFRLSKAIAIPEQKIVSGPLFMKIRKIPTPLAVPFGFFPNKKESSHGILLPGYGNANERGYFVQNLGYFIPLTQSWETSFLFDIYTRGSWVARNRTNYKKNYRYSGNFDVSRTVSKIGFEELPSYAILKTFNVRWTHSQDPKAKPNSRFTANVNAGSSQNFTNNLNSSQTDFLSSTFQSSIQYNKSWGGSPFNLGVSANHNQNTQSRNVTVTLPAVAVTMSRINLFKEKFVKNPIGLNASGSLENSVSARENQWNIENLSGLNRISRNGARYNASLNTSLKGPFGLTINPSVNANWLWTFKYLEENAMNRPDTLYGFRQHANWDAGVGANFRLYGTFVMKKSNAKIKAFRHLMQMNLNYNFTPTNVVKTYGYYAENGDFVGYSIWDVAKFAPTSNQEAQSISFGINNNLEAKVRDKSSAKVAYKKVKLIESLRANASYNFAADSLNFSNVGINGFTTLGKATTINYSSTYSLYQLDTLGRKVNKFLWEDGNQIARMEGTTVALSTRLSGGNGKTNNTERADSRTSEEEDFVSRNRDRLIDFSVPWTLELNYNIRLVRNFNRTELQFDQKWEQSATFRGSFTLFKKLAFNYDSGYNFDTEKLTTTTIGLTWDLHCWEMSGTWIPFGQRASYMVQLNIKSSMLRDLKIQRRGSYGDDLLY